MTGPTQEYIEAIKARTLLEQNQLVIVKNGGDNPGTWLHPKLGIAFARWCNVDFAVWCDEIIEGILKGDVIPVRASDLIILQHRRADVVLNSHLKAAKCLGTDAPMARAIAVDAVKKLTGVDFLPLLAGNVIDEKPMNPTELGKPFDGRAREPTHTWRWPGCRPETRTANGFRPTRASPTARSIPTKRPTVTIPAIGCCGIARS